MCELRMKNTKSLRNHILNKFLAENVTVIKVTKLTHWTKSSNRFKSLVIFFQYQVLLMINEKDVTVVSSVTNAIKSIASDVKLVSMFRGIML